MKTKQLNVDIDAALLDSLNAHLPYGTRRVVVASLLVLADRLRREDYNAFTRLVAGRVDELKLRRVEP